MVLGISESDTGTFDFGGLFCSAISFSTIRILERGNRFFTISLCERSQIVLEIKLQIDGT